MAESKIAKHAFGSKENIESAKAAGTIDAYDVLHLDNGEMAWLDKEGNTVMNTPRTQEDITVNGVTGLGIGNGEVISAGASIDDIIKMLVQKAIPATYTKPTVSISNNGGQASGNIEAGSEITPKLRAVFNKNDAGDLISLSIKKGSDEVITGSSTPQDYEGDSFIIGDEVVSFTAHAAYGDAPIKKNNLGKESKENWFAGGEIVSGAYSVTGKRNLFYGTGVGNLPAIDSAFIRSLANKKLAPTQGFSFTVNVAVGQQYIAFAYPATLRDVNNVTYVEANDSGMAASFTKEVIDVADARGDNNGLMSYKAYVYKMAVPAAASMTFKVTI